MFSDLLSPEIKSITMIAETAIAPKWCSSDSFIFVSLNYGSLSFAPNHVWFWHFKCNLILCLLIFWNTHLLLACLSRFSINGFQYSKWSQKCNNSKLVCSHKKHEVAAIIYLYMKNRLKLRSNNGELYDFRAVLIPAAITSKTCFFNVSRKAHSNEEEKKPCIVIHKNS